ncbi:class I SAM-dependent methyltransferase [Psychrobacter sp. TAE2020]|uniref:class I SAM-dependent methyltransferase n=1 Tax=Psychrobacter sp. TAE2020 TaxID=2846762 RepID=UPI001C1076AF|nr:class I SAM-dependent methyltransferase [Psychrobacter sp. TAE2020]MBU5616638.1 class I SAM-dependent methyltransferase [Psychrobacter sp. TAE2020]
MTSKLTLKLTSIKKNYDNKVLPILIDKACKLDVVSKQRALVVPKAHGIVLEVGVGSGLNAKFYNKQKVKRVIGVDPHLQPLARERFDNEGIELISQPLSAETLPLEDNSVDSIVMTFTLCSIPNPMQALREMRRVLKPAGTLYYAEHGLAPQPKLIGKIQQLITPAWKTVSGGCHLDRDIEQLIAQAGFEVSGQQRFTQGVNIVGYYYWGEASVAASKLG